MKLSTRSRYGIRAILDVALHSSQGPVRIQDIAERQEIPPRYLEQIFQRLKKAGLLKSRRGPRGGYVLARKPEEIRVAEIIRGIGESVEPVFCSQEGPTRKRCPREDICTARLVWREISRAMVQALDSFSIAKMCRMAKAHGLERSKARRSKRNQDG